MAQNNGRSRGGLGNSMWSNRGSYHRSVPRYQSSATKIDSEAAGLSNPEPAVYRPLPSVFSTAVTAAPIVENNTLQPQSININGREFVAPSPTADPNESGINKYVFAFQALKHFEQTCQRLGWKRIDLDASYKRTLEPDAWGFSEEHAEQNFKIDFYEFYQLIERALVLIQRVWGIDIQRGGSGINHNYHENVLRRLAYPDHPLRAYLGTGEGNEALWKAKELRNRWKDATMGKGATHPLKMYNVSWLVKTILDSLQRAYDPSKGKMDEYFRQAMQEGDTQVMETGTGEGAENWDWMTSDMDMDWE